MFYGGVMNGQVSRSELERRWTAVRARMEAQGIDVLLGFSASDQLGGHVRYLLDIPSGGSYPTTVIFPRDDDITIVTHGSHLGDLAVTEGAALRGVKRQLTTPSFSSVGYTQTYEAERADVALRPYAGSKVGIIAPAQVPYPMMDHLRRNSLATAEVVDASDLLDQVKAVKSPEEIGLMRIVAALQDEAVGLAFDQIAPGMEERDVIAIANQHMRVHGSEQGILMSGAGPVGTPSGIRMPFMQGGKIASGDQYHLLLEVNGQEGFYTELGRTCILGTAPDDMHREFELLLELRQVTLDLLRPGTPCSLIWEEHNRFMRERGRPEETRLYSHSQGYDLVERPLVRWDEDMTIEANMVLAVHPMLITSTSFTWICDNFLVLNEGAPERLHAFPERLFEK